MTLIPVKIHIRIMVPKRSYEYPNIPSKSQFYRMGPYKWLNSMVYGRYNELEFMGVFSWFINQHSHHWGASSCRAFFGVMGLLEVGVLRNWPGLTGSPTSLTPVLWREWLISMAQLMGMVVVCCQNRVQ